MDSYDKRALTNEIAQQIHVLCSIPFQRMQIDTAVCTVIVPMSPVDSTPEYQVKVRYNDESELFDVRLMRIGEKTQLSPIHSVTFEQLPIVRELYENRDELDWS